MALKIFSNWKEIEKPNWVSRWVLINHHFLEKITITNEIHYPAFGFKIFHLPIYLENNC